MVIRHDETVAGVLGSAFSWSYAFAQIGAPCWIVSGTRVIHFLSLIGWSVMTMLQGSQRPVGVYRASSRPWHLGGPVLPGQQPRAGQLVPTSNARARMRFTGGVGRPRVLYGSAL